MGDSSQVKSSSMRHWAVFVGCCLLIGISFAFPMLVFGVFVSPMVAAFQCSVTEVSIYFTFVAFSSTISSLLGSRLLRRSVQVTVLVASLVMGGMFFVLALMPSVPMVWATGIVVGCCFPLCTTVLAPIAINNWFAVKQGTLTGAAFAMVGVFGMVLSPTFTALIGSFGWQTALMMGGALVAVVPALVAVFLLRQNPAAVGLLPYGASQAEAVGAAGDAANAANSAVNSAAFVRTTAFLLCAIVAVFGGFFGTFNSQLNTIAQKSGFDAVTAGLALSCASGGLMVGKLLMGSVKDRKGSTFAIVLGCGFGVVAFASILAGVIMVNVPLLYLGSFLSGFCTCLGTLAPALLSSGAFVPQVYAKAVSYLTAVCSLGMGAGIPCYTLGYDLLGSFQPILLVCTLAPIIVALASYAGIKLGVKAQQAVARQ